MKKIDMIVKSRHFYTAESDGTCYQNGAVMLVDRDKILGFFDADKGEILSKAAKHPERIGERASGEFFEIHGTNAVYMEEGKL